MGPGTGHASRVVELERPALPTYDLRQLALSEIVACGRDIRVFGKNADSMEDVAESIVRHFFERCICPDSGGKDVVLVRFFKSHPYGDLDAALQRSAKSLFSDAKLSPATKCLTLLATAGLDSEWNSRYESRGHQAIPLISEKVVAQIPMIAQLVRQFGLKLSAVVDPSPDLLIELDERNYNIFHVEEARGSQFIPAQDLFVKQFQVRSVVGFGGMLPTGNIFAVVIFSRARISRSAAEAFRTIALSVKTSILPFENGAVFRDQRQREQGGVARKRDEHGARQTAYLRSKSAALEELGTVFDRMVVAQSRSLEKAVCRLEVVNRKLNLEIDNRKQFEAEREILNQRLVEASRKAGMAEIATGVLHNLGNTLNSTNVSVSMVREFLEQSACFKLKRASDLINEHADDLGAFVTQDPRGIHLPAFLATLATNLQNEHARIRDEMQSITESIGHVNTIVAMQQAYSSVGGLIEPVALVELVKDALAMHNESFQRSEIDIVCDFEEVPTVTIDKHRVMQILLNLIKNAEEAVAGTGRADKRVVVRIARVDDSRVAIDVSDNGEGIAPENLTRMFGYGYTTKGDKGGHGFGLHHSALLAKELGGQLRAASDGPGKGATLTLELPTTAREPRQATPTPMLASSPASGHLGIGCEPSQDRSPIGLPSIES